jgi:hypothetical protein
MNLGNMIMKTMIPTILLYTFLNISGNSNDPITKPFYVKFVKFLIKSLKKLKKQHYSRRIAKYINKIKTTWNMVKKETGKFHFKPEWMPSVLTHNEKVKDPEKVADAFNSFFLTTAESSNLHQVGKEDAISFIKDSFPGNFPGIKIIPTTEAEIKSITHSLK